MNNTNLIFFDTEFNGNDPYTAELLSLAMVTHEGKELYMEFELPEKIDSWVSQNVLQYLTQKKTDLNKAKKSIAKFIGTNKYRLIGHVYAYDYVYMTKAFSFSFLRELFVWPPIDFASVLWANGVDPAKYHSKESDGILAKLKIDSSKYNNHNALDDARLLREIYLKLTHDGVFDANLLL